MHAAIATAAVGVIGIGAFTMVSPQPGVNFSVFEEKQASSEMQAVLDRTIDARFEGTAFGEVVTYLAESLDENFVINMHDMEDHGLTPADTQIHLRLSNVRVGKVLDLLEEQVNDGSRYLVWNVGDDVIEFGDRERFDRRTSELVSYDIAPVLLNMWEEYDIEYEEARSQIGDVLVSMVSPDDWHDMGGGLAHMNFVGGKIFVEAPKRMHKQIAWILSELADGDQTASTITGPFGPGTGGGFGTGALPPNSATIQPGDVLRIEVFELMQAGEMYAAVQSVGAEQEVRLPNVGGVSTAGKSLGQLERDVRDRLRDVLRDPVVAVFRQSGSMMTGLAGGGAGHASNPLTTTGTGAGGHGGSGGSTLSTGAVGPRAGAGAPGLGGGAGGAGGAGGVATPDRE